MLWFGFLVAVLATLQEFTSGNKVFWIFPSEYGGRLMGPILSPNHYAAFIELVLPMAIYRSVGRERESLLYAGMAAAMYASVVASASRAGLVLTSAEIVVVPTLLWLKGRASVRVASASLLRATVLVAVLTGIVGWGGVWQRLQGSDPFANRREFAIASMRMIAARPLFGFGLGTWPVVYPQYATIDTGTLANRAHDDWLEWTAEGGLPFGIAMATLFLWTLRPAFRSAWGVGVVAVFLHAAVDYPFSRPALAAWIAVAIALLTRAGKQSIASAPTEY
jgi:O-antigen ligase